MQERGNSLNEQAIREAAIAEILHPTLSITRQLLETNKVVLKEHVPIVEDVILREDEQKAQVYFPITGERYYLVIYLHVEPRIVLKWTGISAGNRVYFCATSTERQTHDLVALAGAEPTRTWEKGKHIKHNGFEILPSFKETGDVEDKLRILINLLLPYTANIHALSAIADVGINIAYWGYKEQMSGIHFATDILQRLAVLNLSVDVDLYASGSDLGSS